MSGRCSSWGRLRRARGGSPAGLELASAHGSTARVKGESGAESAARVRAAVLALGSGGARAGRRERRERASGEASTHLEPGQAGVSPLGPRRRSLRGGSSPTCRRSQRLLQPGLPQHPGPMPGHLARRTRSPLHVTGSPPLRQPCQCHHRAGRQSEGTQRRQRAPPNWGLLRHRSSCLCDSQSVEPRA